MKKFLIIDNRMRKIEKEKLEVLGYELIEVPTKKDLYYEVSSHVDIFCAKIKDKIVLESTIFEKFQSLSNENVILDEKIIIGNKNVGNVYPLDILYNVCNIGNFVIHNFKYTDSKILDLIENLKLEKIAVNQGYSKCSIAVIDNNSAITCDKKISKKLKENGIDTLLLDNVNNIKLYSENNRFSNMNGFIGGAISNVNGKIIISGDLKKIDEDDKIRKFIEKRNLEIIEFKGLDVIDYGGIIQI